MKKFIKVILIVFLIYLSTLFYGETVNIKITTFELANGLKVILSPMENLEASCVMLYHQTGVRNDPPEIRGASHLFETLMNYGTQNFEPYDRVFLIRSHGGFSNSKVNYDYSFFSLVVPDTEIDFALSLESQRIDSLRLNNSNITNTKNYYYKRYSSPNIHFLAANQVKELLLQGTVYETPVYGKLESMKDFPNNKIKKIYDNYRNLSNTLIVIAGKMDIAKTRASIEKHFSNLTFKRKPNKITYSIIEPQVKNINEEWKIRNLPQPFIIYGIRAPSKLSPEYVYFDFIRYHLLDKRISKLERVLKKKHNLDVNISYEYTDYFETNVLLIKIVAASRYILGRVKYFMDREWGIFHQKGKVVSTSDFRTVKSLMELDFKKNLWDVEKRCLYLAENYHLKGDLNFASSYLSQLNQLTALDLKRVGKMYLKKENMVILNVYKK